MKNQYYVNVLDVETTNKRFNTKMIVSTGLLLALEIIFQIIGNYVAFGPVSINLSLIPIAVGAILYGPLVGGFLGFCNGIMVILAPTTIALFMSISVWGTILVCLFKCTLAGVAAGFVNKLFKNRKTLGAIISSLLVPVINTGLFCLACITIFRPFLEQYGGDFDNIYLFLILGVVGWNFIFEMGSTTILSFPLSKAIAQMETTLAKRSNY